MCRSTHPALFVISHLAARASAVPGLRRLDTGPISSCEPLRCGQSETYFSLLQYCRQETLALVLVLNGNYSSSQISSPPSPRRPFHCFPLVFGLCATATAAAAAVATAVARSKKSPAKSSESFRVPVLSGPDKPVKFCRFPARGSISLGRDRDDRTRRADSLPPKN